MQDAMPRSPSRTRILAASAALALPLSELGHVAAFAIRCRMCGAALGGTGIHAYLPNLLLMSGSLVAATLLAALLIVGAGRLLLGRRAGLRPSGGVALRDLLLVMAAVQMDTYLLQETVETMASGQAVTLSLTASTLLWGAAGQLPLALLGALAIRWLSMRLRATFASLRDSWRSLAVRPPTPAAAPIVAAPEPIGFALAQAARAALVKRGPPILLLPA